MANLVQLAGVMDAAALRKVFVTPTVPRSEQYRRYYGRSVDMVTIENALRQADIGRMTDLCDLESESMSIDPHLSGVLGKRFGCIAAADWDITPAQGADLDKKLAEEIADNARHAVQRISNFNDVLYDMSWALFDNRALQEIHWAMTPGRIRYMPTGFQWVHPRRIAFGPSRELRIIDPQRAPTNFYPEGLDVSQFPGKFLQWTPRLWREYPEREGLGPRCMYWGFFKRFSWRMRMMLTELFGIPWRIVTFEKDAPFNADSIQEAEAVAERLGAESTAVFDRGTKLETVFPGENTGEIFSMTSKEVDEQTSKLVLGNVGTTDAVANRAESVIQKGEQDIIFQRDGNGISGVVQRDLMNVFTVLNYGGDAIGHAPKFQVRTQPPRDRKAELDRIEKVISFGVAVPVAEVREIAGTRVPNDDEQFLISKPGGRDGMGNPLPPTISIVDPVADAKAAQEASDAEAAGEEPAEQTPNIPLTPSDLATIVTVNEGRASAGLAPLTKGDGTPDPDGELSITEYKAKYAAVVGEAAAATGGDPSGGDATPGDPVAPLPTKKKPDGSGGGSEGGSDGGEQPGDLEAAGADGAAAKAFKDALGLGRHESQTAGAVEMRLLARPPSTVNGSPETLIEKGLPEGVRETSKWAEAFSAATDGASDGMAIHKALTNAANSIDLEKFSRAMERRIVHSLMLGALDADWEAENDAVVKPPAFNVFHNQNGHTIELASAITVGGGVADFTTMPFSEAIKNFLGKRVVTRRTFDRLTAEAKKRAFTVAGLARTEMLKTAQDELAKALTEGSDLRAFRTQLAARFETAGWTAINKSHVEVVFRNGVMGSYASGRHVQMTQPEVIAKRPYWQIMGVGDDRTRDAHKAAHRKVLAWNDPFWSRAPLPWGHQCRCRKVSRSAEDVARLGLQVVTGASLTGLPDEGWNGNESSIG